MYRFRNYFKTPLFATKVICVPGVKKTKYLKEKIKNNLSKKGSIFFTEF